MSGSQEARPAGAPATTGLSRRMVMGSTLAAPLLGHAPRPVDGVDGEADRELLRLCEVVGSLGGDEVEDNRRWGAAMKQVAGLRPATAAGLQAKVRLALSMLPFVSGAPCPDWASPDERLFWALLHDVLALSNDEVP